MNIRNNMIRNNVDTKKILFVILIFSIIIRVTGAYIFPTWAGPDEPSHFFNIKYISENGNLPYEIYEMRPGGISGESHQAPLYYLIGSLIYNILLKFGPSSTIFWLRLFSVFLSVGIIIMSYLVVKEIDEGYSIYVAAFVAFLPTAFVISTFITNDNLAFLFSITSLFFLLKSVNNNFPTNYLFFASLFIGLSVITKLSNAYLWLPVIIVIFAMYKTEEDKKDFKNKTVILILPALFFTLLQFSLFYKYFGTDAFSMGRLIVGEPSFVFRPVYYLTHMFGGFFAQEYGTASIEHFRMYFFYLWAFLSSLAIYGLTKAIFILKSGPKKIVHLLLAASALASLSVSIYINIYGNYPAARHIFVTLPIFGYYILFGIRSAISKTRFERYTKTVFITFILSLLIMDFLIIINHNQVLPEVPWPIE